MRDLRTPTEIVATLAAFVDVLLPGDELFPAASTVGTQALLADRLRALLGAEAVAEAVGSLSEDARSFSVLAPEERVTAVRHLEQRLPDRFNVLRSMTYYAYYQNPAVVQCVRELGFDYNDAPQPRGYEMPPFDPTPGADAPASPRGCYTPTAEVVRIDVSELGVLRTRGSDDA
ncbi:MAG: hypothetical protein ACR2NB_10025 [Solirubrobacteraceae bacterium]